MMGAVNELVGGAQGIGFLDPADYQRTVDALLAGGSDRDHRDARGRLDAQGLGGDPVACSDKRQQNAAGRPMLRRTGNPQARNPFVIC